MLGKWYDGVFIKIEAINTTTSRFWVEIPDVDNMEFRAGQFMTFDLPIAERRNKRWRSYSIASAPSSGKRKSNVLEFVIVFLEGGKGTHYLFKEVKLGTPLKLREAQGVFTLPKALNLEKELCFICTGTGIAPFRSMLIDLKQRRVKHPHINLIFGTRYLDGILYREELTQLMEEMEGFDYHITLSRESSPEWNGPKGYVHPIYEKLYADKRPATFYLCGWNAMLDEARKRLKEMGYDKKGDVIFESYG